MPRINGVELVYVDTEVYRIPTNPYYNGYISVLERDGITQKKSREGSPSNRIAKACVEILSFKCRDIRLHKSLPLHSFKQICKKHELNPRFIDIIIQGYYYQKEY